MADDDRVHGRVGPGVLVVVPVNPHLVRGHVQEWFDGCLSYEHEQKIVYQILDWCHEDYNKGYETGFEEAMNG